MKMQLDKTKIKTRLADLYHKNRALIWATVLTIFASVLFWGVVGYTYETNDDAYMATIVNGYHGEHSNRLIFVNIAVGTVLSWLFALVPSVPWYFVAICGIQALSYFGIFYIILKKWDNVAVIIPIAVVFTCFASDMFTDIQFTKVAGLAGISGGLLLLYALSHKGEWLIWCIGFFLAIAGFCYRLNAFAMVVVLLSGAGLYELIKIWKTRDWRQIYAAAATLVAVALVCAGLNAVNKISYQKDPAWKEYKVYNSLRSRLLDYGFPDYKKNEELYTKLNISQTDVQFYSQWNFDDPEIMSLSAMQQLANAKSNATLSVKGFIRRTEQFLQDFMSHEWFVGFAAVVAAAFLFGEKKKRWLLFFECIVFSALEMYLIYRGRYGKNRVDISLGLAVVCVLFLYCIDKEKMCQDMRRLSLVFLAMTIIFSQVTFLTKRQNEIIQKRDDSAMLYSIFGTTSTDKERMYFSKDHGLPVDRYTGLAGPVGLQANACYLGGWLTHSPIILEKQRNYGITNPYRDMIDNDNVRLLSKDIEDVMTYIRDHYAKNATAEQIKLVSGEYPVYCIVTKALDLQGETVSEAPAEAVFAIETNEKNAREISGIMYLPETNSFASNIYLGAKDEQGQDAYFYTLQTLLPGHDRIMDGKYGAFSAKLDDLEPGEYTLTVYLETDGALYTTDGGMITIPQ